jgi:hypothetical protein
VDISDALVNPSGRWQARAALAAALAATGDESAAASTATEARAILVEFAGTLAPGRAETLLAAPQARDVLASGA